jgi:hypothetical protein
MDIVLFIALITALACVEVCAALLYRGWELSHEDISEHVRVRHTMCAYAEDGADHMLTWCKDMIVHVWVSFLVPLGTRMKTYMVRMAADFAPTAYIMRVYNAIRGLHTTKGEEEDTSEFLQKIQEETPEKDETTKEEAAI